MSPQDRPTPGHAVPCAECGATLVRLEHIGRDIWYCVRPGCKVQGRLTERKVPSEAETR
jgi:ribosomal protein L37AE/L43A